MAGEEVAGNGDADFSFPTTTSSPPRFIGSPRLWRSSSNSLYLHQFKLTTQKHEQECELTGDDRKAINLLSYIRKKDGDGDGENMDVIWEDLNYEEEIGGSGGSCDFSHEMAEWGRKEKIYGEVAAAYGGRKRRSVVVWVKVLKKLLLFPGVYRIVKK